MKIGEYKQMMSYLTKPNRVFTSKPKQEAVKKEKPKQEFDVASNVMMNQYKYDDVDKGTEKEIRKYLIQKIDSGKQLNSDEVRFMMDTKENQTKATPAQMKEVKNNLKKTKETEQPFKPKKTLKPEPSAREILEDIKINMPEIVDPIVRTQDEIEAEKRFNDMMQKAEEEKQRIKNSGLAYLMGGAEK